MRARAKASRRASTVSELRLWNWLRNRTFSGQKFRRQVPIGPYVVDFYCAQLKLVIEVDGAHHENPEMWEYDTTGTAYLNSCGIEVVRISNEVLARDMLTAEQIIHWAVERRS